ncbi:MAG: transporter [Arenicellales bacterium]
MRVFKKTCAILATFLLLALTQVSFADDLAKQSQNPLGTIISFPLENNFYTGIGPSGSSVYALNLKPVYPIKAGNWNLVNRFILPAIYSEGQDVSVPPGIEVDTGYSGMVELAQGSAFGLGDLTYQAFFSPADSENWIWGLGPAFVLPTATEERYASNKWSLGAAFVALSMPGNWVYGVLAQNVWSVAGDSDVADVNSFLFQYFLNYNLDNGWYLSSTPVITANWESESDDRWTVPLGGGVGRLVKHGKLPVDYKLTAYNNVEKPEFAPDWNVQFTVKFLFPKK